MTTDAQAPLRLAAGQDAVRAHNLQAVARFVRRQGETSRRAIGDELGLNKATVSSLVAELIARGLLEETARTQISGPGRPSAIVRIDRTHQAAIVVEVLADTIRLEARALSLDLIAQRDLPAHGAPEVVVPLLADGLVAMLGRLKADERQITGIMIAVPGLLDTQSGTIVASEPLGWSNIPLLTLLRKRKALRDLHLEIGRIASLATIAESRRLPDYSDILCLHGGTTGIGAAAMVSGSLLTGSRGRAGELLFPRLAPNDVERTITPDDAPRPVTLENLVAQLRQPETGTAHTLNRLAGALAERLSTLVALLDPAAVILAGHLAPLTDTLAKPLMTALQRHLTPRPAEYFQLRAGAYGPEATAVGGTTLLADRAFSNLGSR